MEHIFFFVADTAIKSTINQSTNTFQHLVMTLFNARSIGTFVLCLLFALIVGHMLTTLGQRLTRSISNRADKARTLNAVNQLRRWETYVILSIALIRMMLVIVAIYFWWVLNHPFSGSSTTALISAGAVLTLILSGAAGPLLRDFTYGAAMMAEHWYGIGDFIAVDQIPHAEGVVERVTLRSTRIRSVNGEVMWISNQSIGSVRVAPRGVTSIAVELFVSNLDRGLKLVDDTNLRLPTNAIAVATPFSIINQDELGHNLWHITALGEAAAGREWFLDRFAIQILKDLDEQSKHPVLLHEPLARFADPVAERRFARTIRNSRKAARQPRLQRLRRQKKQ